MATKPKPHISEMINPKARLARQMSDAGLDDDEDDYVVPEQQMRAPQGGMSQADFSYGSGKKKGSSTPPAEMLKRRAKD